MLHRRVCIANKPLVTCMFEWNDSVRMHFVIARTRWLLVFGHVLCACMLAIMQLFIQLKGRVHINWPFNACDFCCCCGYKLPVQQHHQQLSHRDKLHSSPDLVMSIGLQGRTFGFCFIHPEWCLQMLLRNEWKQNNGSKRLVARLMSIMKITRWQRTITWNYYLCIFIFRQKNSTKLPDWKERILRGAHIDIRIWHFQPPTTPICSLIFFPLSSSIARMCAHECIAEVEIST